MRIFMKNLIRSLINYNRLKNRHRVEKSAISEMKNFCFQVSTRNLSKVTKNSDGNSNKLKNPLTLNHGDLQSIFESTAIKLIDEYFGFHDLDYELGDHRRQMIEQTRLGYPQRTLHLSNKYDMDKKKWDLENTLKVMVFD